MGFKHAPDGEAFNSSLEFYIVSKKEACEAKKLCNVFVKSDKNILDIRAASGMARAIPLALYDETGGIYRVQGGDPYYEYPYCPKD